MKDQLYRIKLLMWEKMPTDGLSNVVSYERVREDVLGYWHVYGMDDGTAWWKWPCFREAPDPLSGKESESVDDAKGYIRAEREYRVLMYMEPVDGAGVAYDGEDGA